MRDVMFAAAVTLLAEAAAANTTSCPNSMPMLKPRSGSVI